MNDYVKKIKASVEVKECDYNGLIDAVKQMGKIDNGIFSLGLDFIKIFSANTKKKGIVDLFSHKVIRDKICNEIEKILYKNGIVLHLKELKIEKRGECLEILLEAQNYNYSNIFELIMQIVRKQKKIQQNEYSDFILSLISLSAQTVGETITEELKDEIIFKMINTSSNEICSLVNGIIKKQYKIDILLENLKICNLYK